MFKQHVFLIAILFALTMQVKAQKPATNKEATINSFTGKKIEQSIVTAGVDFVPNAKLKTIEKDLGLSDIIYKKITGGDFSSCTGQGKKMVVIPKYAVPKLESSDNSATLMFVFALSFHLTNESTALKNRVLMADKKALKYMKENTNATFDQVKASFNKLLETPELIGYPTKAERLKVVKEMFPQDNPKPDDSDDEEIDNTVEEDSPSNNSNLEKGDVYVDNDVNFTRYVIISNANYTKEIMVLSRDEAWDYDVPVGIYNYTLKDENHKFISIEEIKVVVGKTITLQIND